jgi:hypothetical protein
MKSAPIAENSDKLKKVLIDIFDVRMTGTLEERG